MIIRKLPANAILLALVALILFGYGPATASPIPGPEFTITSVSTAARYNQEYVDICAGGGVYLAVWQDRRSGVDYDIYGILVDSEGSPVVPESFLISKMTGGTPAPGDQLYPAVGWNGTDFLVAWADRRAVNLIPRIYATRVTTTGQVLDENGVAFPTAATPTDQLAPQIASNGTTWVVTWQERSAAGSDDVYVAVVSDAGTVSGRLGIALRTDNEQWPAIAWNGTNYLVVWQDYRNSESTGTDIYGCRLTSSGTKVASSEKMISTAPGSSTVGAAGAQSVPSVAASSAGVWLVVWQDLRGADDDIYCARVSSAGTLQDLGGVMVSSAADMQEEPSVGWDGTYFLAAWRDKGSSRNIRGSRISTGAVVLDPAGITMTAGSAGPYGPAVAGQSGSSLVAWYSLDVMNSDVYGIRVNSAGALGSLRELSLCIQDQPQYSSAFDGTNYVVTWADRRSGMYRVYAARVSTAGVVLDAGGVLVTATAAGDQTQPSIAWNGTNYLVVWTEMGAMFTDIKGMRLTTALARVDPSPLNLCIVDQDQHSPAVAWSGTYFLVAWVDYRNAAAPNYYCDVRGARVSPAGVITAVSAIGGADNNQWAPSVASCGGNFLVAWEDYRSGSSVVYCNRVTSAGTVQDGTGIQAPDTAYYNVQPKVASDGTNYLIVWSDKRVGWSNDNIYGVRWSTAGARLDPADIVVCSATKAQVAPCAFWNGTNYLVAWQDYRNSSTTGYDIYLNMVSSEGAVVDPADRLISGGPHPEVNPAVITSGAGPGLALYSNFINGTYRTAGRALSEPPPIPVVTDDGAYTTVSTSLHATWSAAPREAEVVEYRYAIGTAPGATDVVGWTSAGLLTGVTHVGLSLVDGFTYFFSVETRNAAGTWGEPGVSDGIIVDASAPSTPVVTDDGQYSTSSTSLHATWSSADPHTGIQEYQYAIGTSAGATDVVGWTSAGVSTEITRSDLTLADGTTYFFSVQARNGAGTWSIIGSSDGILVDSTAPALPTVTDDGAYTTSTTTLHATWSSPDPQTSIAEYQFAIGTAAQGTDVLDWTSTGTEDEVTKTGLSLSGGVTYYISVKARNAAGLWSGVGSSDGIIVDPSAPTTPVVTDDGAYTTSHDSLHATWSSSDPQSGIVEYRYAIGTSIGGNNIVDWTSTATTAGVTKTGLSLTDGTTCYFSVQAKNGAGVWSASGSSDGIMVDGSAPSTPVVTDDGDYQQSLTTLHAIWSATDPHSGIAEYRYAIGTFPGSNDVVDWTSAGTATEVTRTGLTLAEGTAYCFSVEAGNGAGIWSAWGASDGIGVDASPPTTPVVTDDGAYTAPDRMHATWTSSDPHTGIAEYQYAIGTTVGGNNIVDWTSTGTTASVTRTGLSLIGGTTYYLSVKARNAAGLWSAVGSSDGIMVDTSAPTTPVVTDDGVYTASSSSLHATWTASDPQSGIAEYKYAIGTSVGGNNIVDWTSTGTTTGVTRTGLSLADGTIYYFSVQAKNGAGAWSASGNSDGIMVDASAPTTPVVTDDGAYTTSSSSLHATWTASDPQSGIQEYKYAIGTSAGGNNIVDWTSTGTTASVTKTGLSLANGTIYYFSVKAKNGAGAWSSAGNSDGIMVDASAPTTPVVTDDGVYTSDPGSLHATWTASDPQSGIVEYKYAIGTTAGGNDIIDWTSTGTTAGVTRTGLSLTDGVTYYFSVQARNAAGLWSSVGSSDGITVSTAPPTTPIVTDDGDYTLPNILHATWTVENPHGTIQEYQYAIGTSAGGSNIVGWTSVGTATEVTRTGLSLSQGPTYYISVKARKGSTWSEVGSSNGIVVPPAVATILTAKFTPNGEPLRLNGNVVTAGTAGLPDLPGPPYFYIEQADRVTGIKVVSSQTIPTGGIVDIAGVIETVDGERQITASVVSVVSTGGAVPGVLNMMDRAIGGAQLNEYTPGVFRDSGPHNVGSLVKTWGKVTYVGGAGEDYFYLNGGSFLRDGSGHVGVRVYCGALTKPAVGSSVLVRGISSCEPLSTELVRRVLATQIDEYP